MVKDIFIISEALNELIHSLRSQPFSLYLLFLIYLIHEL